MSKTTETISEKNVSIAMSVSWSCIACNVVLTAFKLFAGIFAHSAAMLSDAVHTFSDVVSTVVVIIGVKLSNQKADKEHPYGHERLECIAALILAAILFLTGIGIGYAGIEKVVHGNSADLVVPGVLALIAAILSILVKEGMFWYARAAAKKIDSGALMADAWHHRSDALSSVGSFIGILGARMGFPILDPLVCIVICLFILKAAFDIFVDSIGKMTDKSCDDEIVEEIRSVIMGEKDVMRIDLLRTRLFGNKIYVDVEICIDGDATLRAAHDIAQRVHDAIETEFPKVKHCMVHMNPSA